MRSVNTVLLLGNVGNEPEVRSTTGGKRVATFSLATNESWTNEAGVKQEKTEWHRIVVWEALAEIVEKYVVKGSPLWLSGKIAYRQWQDKDGETRYSTEITAREIVLLGGRKPGAENGNTPPHPASSASSAAGERKAAPAGKAKRAARKSAATPADADYEDSDETPF